MTGWGKAVLTYPPTWVAAVVLGATVWLVLEIIDPPVFMVVVLAILAVVADPRVAAHDVGDGHPQQAAVRDSARRRGGSE